MRGRPAEAVPSHYASDICNLLPRLVEKRQHHKRFRVKPVLGAYTLRQGKVAFGLGQIVEVEIECCKAIIARKQQLRLARFPGHLQCFVEKPTASSGWPLHWWICPSTINGTGRCSRWSSARSISMAFSAAGTPSVGHDP